MTHTISHQRIIQQTVKILIDNFANRIQKQTTSVNAHLEALIG